MIWYQDCGKYHNKEIILNTHVWNKQGSEVIVNYFSLCGWNSKIVKDRHYYRVKLDENSSLKFIQTIQHELPGS